MSDRIDALAAKIIQRLGEGEGAISTEFTINAAEREELRREFKEAEDALDELVTLARRSA